MRNSLTFSAALALVLLAAGSSPAADSFKAEYRMQVTVGPTTAWGMGATRFAKRVAEKTGGRINVKPYFGGQLLKGAQLNSSQMTAMGAIDCALESTINTAPVIPEMNVFCLPFYVRTFEAVDRMENGKTGQRLFEAMRERGLEPLAWGENGFRQLTNSKRDVRTPADLKGLRIRVVGSPLFVDIFRGLGADPINMNWGDAITAFQQGTVDGQENPMGILIPSQIQQFHKHLTAWNYAIDPLIFYWNRKQWSAFPADIQKALMEAAAEAGQYQKAVARAGLDGARSLDLLRETFHETPEPADPFAFLAREGVSVHPLTPEALESFVLATAAVRDAWRQKLGPDIMAAADTDLAEPNGNPSGK